MSMPVPFCGRDAQMTALSEQLSRARGGAGAVVLVEGDAGMGKSRLLDEAAAVARRRGFRIGISAADPGDSMVELATLMAALFDARVIEVPDPGFRHDLDAMAAAAMDWGMRMLARSAAAWRPSRSGSVLGSLPDSLRAVYAS